MLAAGLLGAGILYTQDKEELLGHILFRPPAITNQYPKLKTIANGVEYWEKVYSRNKTATHNLVLFYLHGRNANVEHSIHYLEKLHSTLRSLDNENKIRNIVLIANEYPGYSPTTSGLFTTTEKLCKKAARLVFEFISVRYFGFEFVIIGKSIGSGIASWLTTLSIPKHTKQQQQRKTTKEQKEVDKKEESKSKAEKIDGKDSEIIITTEVIESKTPQSLHIFPRISVTSQQQRMHLVLISPYVSIKHLAQDYYVGLLVDKNCLSNLQQMNYLQNISLLVIHGLEDRLIHWRHSLTLYNAAATKKKRIELIPGADHISIEPIDQVSRFIMQHILHYKLLSNCFSLTMDSFFC